jgi:fermentation-respiration switch protein FrsA (DUF1100 family)
MLAWAFRRSAVTSLFTPIAYGTAGFVAASVAAGVAITETSIRISNGLRIQPDEGQAHALAKEVEAHWESVEIRGADEVLLRGWLFSPHGGMRETVLVQHGLASSRHGILSIARMLLRNGFRVLTPDSRGHGASGDSVVTFGIRESEDMRRWSRWLREKHDARAVFVLGESMGAATALQATAEGAPFEAVVAECPFADFPRIVHHRLGWRWGLPRPLTPVLTPVVRTAFAYARLRYGVDLNRASPLDAVRRVRVPTLLVHGADDCNIPPEHSQLLAQANPEFVSLWIVAGAAHTDAGEVVPEEFERRVVAWFRAAITPPSVCSSRPLPRAHA